MSAGKQIDRQANKLQKNEQCGSNHPKGLPQAESHKFVDSASQGGYSWLIANWKQRYATGIEDFGRVAIDRGREPALLVPTYTPHRGAVE